MKKIAVTLVGGACALVGVGFANGQSVQAAEVVRVAANASADARLPGDDPLPPVSFMLNPVGPPPGGGGPPAPSRSPSPSLALATEAAQAAMDTCATRGLKIGVAVIDAEGNLRVGLSAVGSPAGRIYTAARKGLAAIEFKVPTSQLRELVAADSTLVSRITPRMAVFGGAVPLIVSGRVLGAIGVSGASTQEDEACAAAGAEKIRTRLD